MKQVERTDSKRHTLIYVFILHTLCKEHYIVYTIEEWDQVQLTTTKIPFARFVQVHMRI
jgi:hypothetical protein